MERTSNTRRGVLTLTGGALVALAGCGSSGGQEQTPTETDEQTDETDTEEPTATDTEEQTATDTDSDALLRVAHLSPDAPNVDVAVDGETVLADVPFGTVSEYLPLAPGEYQVTVTPTGGTDPVFDETVPVESGLQTAAAIGEVSGDNQPFSVTLLSGDDTLADPGSARVRAVHTIPDAPNVDVTAGETVLVDNLAFGETSDYVTAPSDTTAIELRPDSETNDADPAGTFSVDLTDQAVHTAFATGYLNPTEDQPGATVIVATDAEPEEMGTATETATETMG